MQRKSHAASTFFIFLLFCIFILGVAKLGLLNGLTSQVNLVTAFFGRNFYSIVTNNSSDSRLTDLQKQNAELLKKLKDYKVIKNENNALKDQFQNNVSKILNLLPAKIIGAPAAHYVIDKGEIDGVKVGQVVIINDMAVGKVVKTSSNISKVNLIFNQSSSLTSKDIDTQALGIVKGLGNNELLLDNVLLSERLGNGDIIVTKGDMDMQGIGFPPDLIIGKITSVDKKPSALFQTAKIKSPIDFERLSTVFIVLGLK